ncbi:MAG: hypothetical protein ACXWDJ_09430, partial [Aeromicrobium sp.]
MSTATHVETIDMTRPGIPMSRLVKVELRKLVDTRAGMWLLISIAALSALVMVILIWVLAANDESATFEDFVGAMSTPMGIVAALITTGLLIWGNDDDLTFGTMSGLMNIPTGFLLPVLAILLVTSEWG